MPYRYQNQPWYVKVWRRRFQLLIPYYAVDIYFANKDSDWPLSLKNSWRVAVGGSHVDMNWVYTLEECQAYWSNADDS